MRTRPAPTRHDDELFWSPSVAAGAPSSVALPLRAAGIGEVGGAAATAGSVGNTWSGSNTLSSAYTAAAGVEYTLRRAWPSCPSSIRLGSARRRR
jgi:hypothetical protein